MNKKKTEEEKSINKSLNEKKKKEEEAYYLELTKKELANPVEMNYQVLVKLEKLNLALNSISQQLYSTNQILAAREGINIEGDEKESPIEQTEKKEEDKGKESEQSLQIEKDVAEVEPTEEINQEELDDDEDL